MSGKEQTFSYSLAKDAKYGSGLRDYTEYRDLGFSGSTNGLVRAHVLRAAKPCSEGGTGRHSHGVDFQMDHDGTSRGGAHLPLRGFLDSAPRLQA